MAFARPGGGGAIGNGITGGGTLTVTNSTFSYNGADNYGGAIGGAIENRGTINVTNSTFLDDAAENTGGYIDNTATCGDTGNAPCAATLRNTIVAGGAAVRDNCAGTITDGGHNLDDGTSCGFSAANGSLSNTDPQLDPAGLQDNGGPTLTIGLVPTSPAIDAGDQTVCATPPVNNLDQRGFVRPGSGHKDCSIGAYEADALPPMCIGDCNSNQQVTISNLILLVNIALGSSQPSACPNGVPSGAKVDIALLVKAVNNALSGCGGG